MMQNMRQGVPALFKGGTKHLTGVEATILRNIEACADLADMTRTSLGPNGMNKMVINHLDKLFVTSDAATIMREMEIAHPAAKMVIMAADMQEVEVGDGSNYVVALAGSMLKKAAELIEMGVHPTEVVEGYEVAYKAALEIAESLSTRQMEGKQLFDEDQLARGIRAVVAAKQYGQEEVISKLVAKACLTVMPENPYNFNVDNIRVCKLLGGAVKDSEIIKGMVFPFQPKGQVRKVDGANIAVFTCSFDQAATETKGQVLINNAEELENYSQGEEANMEAIVRSIADSGVNVIVTGQAVGEMALHFASKFGILVLKLSSQWELRRLCRATKANPLTRLQPVDPRDQGHCSSVVTKEIGELFVTVFSQEDANDTAVATILLRGSTFNALNDIERATDDGVNVIRAMGRDARFVPGAGAFDIEMARRLAGKAATREGVDQYAFKAYGEAFEVVPRTLAENAGMDAMNVLADLYAAHERGETGVGVDIEDHGVIDVTETVEDHLATKIQAIKLATNAALTILRTDAIIQSKPAGGPRVPQNQGHWDDQ